MRTCIAAALLCLLAVGRLAAADGDTRLSADYVLGPDDVIEVTVPNHPDLHKVLTILPDGKIAYPEVGEVKAAGKTPRALADEIAKILDRNYNNVEVYVTVQQVHSRRVRVMGAVRTPVPVAAPGSTLPGQSAPMAFDLKPNWRVVDVIAAAGGLTAKPKMVVGRIVRGSTVLQVDVPAALAAPDSEANVLLEPDDLVILDQLDAARNTVGVMGQVAKPGSFEMQDGLTLMGLLSLAGNTTERAALRRAYVMRGTAKLPVDLHAVIVGGQATPEVVSFALEPGDMLFVPENEEKIGVMGFVRSPGYYTFPEARTTSVLEALGMAGGQAPDADLRKAGVLRFQDGKWTVIPVDLEDMAKKGPMLAAMPMQPTDVLFVPNKRKKFVWTDILSPLTTLGYLGLRPF